MGNNACISNSNIDCSINQSNRTLNITQNEELAAITENLTQQPLIQKMASRNFLDKQFSSHSKATKQLSFQLNQSTANSEKYIQKLVDSQKENFEIISLKNVNQTFRKQNNKEFNISFQILDIQKCQFSSANSIILPTSQVDLIKQSLNYSRQNSYKKLSASHAVTHKKIVISTDLFVKVKNQKFEDSYQLLKKIGQGSFGNVYEAKQLKNNFTVAVKIFKKSTMRKLRQVQKLNAEIQILRTLDHPNIIKIYDVYHTDDHYYVVTEYCCGGNIRTYLQKKNQIIDSKIVKEIMKQILYGLSYLHSKQIIHRDIKLDNIVFVNDPDKYTNVEDIQIKILDFGLAVKAKFKTINMDHNCIGTPKYMSPEIFSGKYSEKCDTWSCGIILHIFLTGRFPFTGEGLNQLAKKITTMEISYSTSFWMKQDKRVVKLVQGLLQKNYQKRITAAQALSSDWFLNKSFIDFGSEKQILSKKIIDYKNENNLVTFAEYFIVFRHKKIQQKDLVTIFQEIDKNNNGTIQIQQLAEFFPQMFSASNKHTKFKQIIQKLDKDNSGRLQISQFMAAITDRNKLFTKDNLMQVFSFLDTNKNNYIERQQIQKAMPNCQIKEYEALMLDIDMDKDGKISKEQFLQYFYIINYDCIL